MSDIEQYLQYEWYWTILTILVKLSIIDFEWLILELPKDFDDVYLVPSVSGHVIATHSLGLVADAILEIFCTFIGKYISDQIYDKLSSSVNHELTAYYCICGVMQINCWLIFSYISIYWYMIPFSFCFGFSPFEHHANEHYFFSMTQYPLICLILYLLSHYVVLSSTIDCNFAAKDHNHRLQSSIRSV